MKSFLHIITACCSLFLGLVSPVYAIDCNAPSPTLKAERSIFEIPAPEALSTQQRRYTDTIFSRLEGEWEGSTSRIECLGSEGNPRTKKTTSEISLNIEERGSNSLRLQAEIYKPKIKSTYREHFSLHQTDGFLRVDSTGSAGDIEIRRLKNNELVVVQRYFIRHQIPSEKRERPEEPLLKDIVWIKPVPEVSIQPVDEVTIQPVDEVTIQPVQQRPLEDFNGERLRTIKKAREDKDESYYGGTMNELERRIKVNGNQLLIETRLYTNGYLASYEQWRLKS